MKHLFLLPARWFRKILRQHVFNKLIDWTQGEGVVFDIILPHSGIKNQGRTTNCWAYSMSSLLESELSSSGTYYTINPLYFAANKRFPGRRGGLPQTFLDVYANIKDSPSTYGEWINPAPQCSLPCADDFMVLTSFAHHPYYTEAVLNVPDNYEHFPSLNVPLDKLVQVVKHSLAQGHTVVWEGDIHGSGYSHKKGVALTCFPSLRHNAFTRSLAYALRLLCDDHMMHIIGMGHTPQGKCFFLLKNSIGEGGVHKGYIHMSEDYLMTNTLTITVRRDIFATSPLLHPLV